MKIYKPEIIEDNENVKIQCRFETAEGTNNLWYLFDKKYSDYLITEKLDGFVAALLLLAMKKGEDIYLEGAISEKLYYNLTNYYINIVKSYLPELNIINIYPESLCKGTSYECENKVGTGFSGGVDSFCTVYDHLINEKTPESYRLTHFIFNNAGSNHSSSDSEPARALFNKRYEHLKGFPDELGIDFIKIDSNLSEILEMDFVHTHTPRNLSSILLLQKLFNKYYYASGLKYEDSYIAEVGDMARTDCITLGLLSTETLDFIFHGAQYSRTKKTEIISNYDKTYKYLNVCVSDTKKADNCSVCHKCCRTLLTLEILGKIENYKNIFDLKKYYSVKNKYLFGTSIFHKTEKPLYKEITDLMKKYNYKISFVHKTIGKFLNSALLMKHFARKFKFVILNLFQHLSNVVQIPKQVRNDTGQFYVTSTFEKEIK